MNVSIQTKNFVHFINQLKKQLPPESYYKILDQIQLICSVEIGSRNNEITHDEGQNEHVG